MQACTKSKRMLVCLLDCRKELELRVIHMDTEHVCLSLGLVLGSLRHCYHSPLSDNINFGCHLNCDILLYCREAEIQYLHSRFFTYDSRINTIIFLITELKYEIKRQLMGLGRLNLIN
jgi:hypothetical protein